MNRSISILKSGNIENLFNLLSKTDLQNTITKINLPIEEIDKLIFNQNEVAIIQFRKVLRGETSKEPLYPLFKKLIEMNSKSVKNFLIIELKKILQNEDTASYYSITKYLRLLNDYNRIELCNIIPPRELDKLILILFDDPNEEDSFNEEDGKAFYFLVELGFPVFKKVIDLIRKKSPEEILNLFKHPEFSYYAHLKSWDITKFFEGFDDSVTKKCLKIFTMFLIEDFQEVKYDINGISLWPLVPILTILIEKNKKLWKVVFDEEIDTKPKEEILEILLFFLIEGCLQSLSKEYLSQYFKSFSGKSIGKILVQIFDEANPERELYLKKHHFEKFGEKCVPITLYMLKSTQDWEETKYYTSMIDDFKEEYPNIFKDEILKFLKDDLSDVQIETFLCETSTSLGDTQKATLLLDEMYNIINKIKSMEDGQSRYQVIKHIIQFFLEKGLKLPESQKTKSIEFLMHILFLNMDIDIVLYVENESPYQFVQKLFDILEYYDIIELLNNKELKVIENLSSHYKRRSHLTFVLDLFYLIYLKLRMDPERIIKIHKSIPESLKKEIFSIFKTQTREYNNSLTEYALFLIDNEPDEWSLYYDSPEKHAGNAEDIVKILKFHANSLNLK